MTSYVTPKKNTAFKFYVGLIDQSNTKLLKANPTIASGDFKVSTDGGAFGNLATLPSANPASGRAVMIDLSNTEMNGDNVVVQCVDAAGAEWCDLMVQIQTTAQQVDDLATAAAVAAVQADLPQRITKNVALSAFPFYMVDSTDHVTGKTSLTVTATRSIDGAAFGACANAVVEVANGWYKIDLAAADLNGNTIALKFTATGADQNGCTIVTEPT